MKKILLSMAVVLSLSTPSFAEKLQDEAVDSLTTAQKLVKEANYSKAVDEINYALSKVNELTAAGLVKYIPEPPAGFTLVNKQAQGVGAAAAIAGNAGATAEYASDSGASVNLNIAIGGMTGKMAGMAALGSLLAGMNQNAGSSEQSRQVRVQGYTGTEIFDTAGKTGTLSFQLGEKTSVTLEGSNIDSPDVLMQFVKNIDLAGLEKNF
ncbi:MAG: hypothetical protein A2X81_19245 [Desulfobacterales bacterium GWB2_56_26]|nr:MAG: hypothetical protein A2X81_19245 [Desulfobacterales bacterium GWB2_56_26]